MQQLEMHSRAPRPETTAKYEKAKALIIGGMGFHEACEKVKMARVTYIAHEEKYDENPAPRKRVGGRTGPKPKPTYVDIPMKLEAEDADEKTVVIVCKTSQLRSILKGL